VARKPSSIDAIADAVGGERIDYAGLSSPDGAVTLLFTDIEGSTDAMERLGEGRWIHVLRDHSSIVRQLVGGYEGMVVKSQGDGFMCSFVSAHSALRCAIEMQRTFAGHSVPELGQPLRVRIGLHAGFVIADADDFFGRNVVLAARIADHAKGGEVLVSSILKQYTETDPSFRFEDRGEFTFKGLLGEHEVYAVDWDAEAEQAGAA
jgi:class 3 adenylate cyclase